MSCIPKGVNLIFNDNDLDPVHDPKRLWEFQIELMIEAENLFGMRDYTKKIYQPSWDVDGPHIRYTPEKDGAFAELGFNAKFDWRMVCYQLAHETVHLLDQHGGDRTHNFEEGAAVRFSLDMMNKYGFNTDGLPVLESYKSALALFNQLDENPYTIAKNCRRNCGNFISFTEASLKDQCPELDDEIISKLLQQVMMR